MSEWQNHKWQFAKFKRDSCPWDKNESGVLVWYDTGFVCPCGAILNVRTYEAGKIEHLLIGPRECNYGA